MTTTDILIKIVVDGNQYHFGFANGITDGTETAVQILGIAGDLVDFGKHLDGTTLNEIHAQCSDGSILATLRIYAKTSGRVLAVVGNERTSNQRTNSSVTGLTIPIVDGMILKCETTD